MIQKVHWRFVGNGQPDKSDGGYRKAEKTAAAGFKIWAKWDRGKVLLAMFGTKLPSENLYFDSFLCESVALLWAMQKIETILVQLWSAGLE